MSDNSKACDRVTEILDEAFNKEWDTFSPEEYKHQLKCNFFENTPQVDLGT